MEKAAEIKISIDEHEEIKKSIITDEELYKKISTCDDEEFKEIYTKYLNEGLPGKDWFATLKYVLVMIDVRTEARYA